MDERNDQASSKFQKITAPEGPATSAKLGVKKSHLWEELPRSMIERDGPFRDLGLDERFDGLRRAVSAARDGSNLGPGDIPSAEETRELLGAYAKLPSEDLRRALLDLLRAIIAPEA